MPKRPTKDEREGLKLAQQELEQYKKKILKERTAQLEPTEFFKSEYPDFLQLFNDMFSIESTAKFLENPKDEIANQVFIDKYNATISKNKTPPPDVMIVWYNIQLEIIALELRNKFHKSFDPFFFGMDGEKLTDKEAAEAEKLRKQLEKGREKLFEQSNYGKMYKELQAMPQKLLERTAEIYAQDSPNTIAGQERTEEQALTYYFALHPDIDPTAAYNLTQRQHTEIVNLFKELDSYLAEHIDKLENPAEIENRFFFFVVENDQRIRTEHNLPVFNPKTISYYVMPNTKVVNTLADILTPEAQEQENKAEPIEAEITLHEDKKNKPVTTYILAQVDNINLPSTFTPYDREVYNAVCSIWEADPDKVLTPQTIYRTMTRKKKGEFVPAQQINEIDKSIEKMRHIQITIDATKEARAYGYTAGGKPLDSFKLNDYLLSLRKVEVNAGGNIVTAYKIHAEPLLLQYSKFSKQIITLPANLLEIKTTSKKKEPAKVTKSSISLLPDASPIANSEQRIVIKGYLLRTIATIQNTKTNRSTKILINTLLEACNLDVKNKARYVEYILNCLDYWTAVDHIKGYTIEKQGKTTRAIIIDP